MQEIRRKAGSLPSLEALLERTGSKDFQALAQLYRDCGTRSGRSLPPKSEFRPEELGAFIANTAVISFDEEGEPVFRLVGEKIRELFDKSPVGKRYRDYVVGPRSDSAVQSFQKCRDSKCGMFVRLRKTDRAGRILDIDVLCLPFANGDLDDVESFVVLDAEGPTVDWDVDGTADLFIPSILSRDFIDLGHGVPLEHVDFVLADD